MKKILSILLALSIACGSIMLTSCSDDEKEDDDDKRASDEEKDEDEDKSSKDDEDESSKDDEDESSKDDEDESSKDDDESSKDDESSEDDDESLSTDYDYEYEQLNFEDVTVEIFGETCSWPFQAAPFCDYFGLDADETVEADDWDWAYNDDYTVEVDYYNPSADAETTIGDCYVDYVSTEEPADVFEFTINGVGVGSSLDDINDAFGTEFTLTDGELDINDEEYWNSITFTVEDGTVTYLGVYADDSYFSDEEDEGGEGGEEAAYVAGDTITLGDVSFTVPEGFEGEVGSDYASLYDESGFGAIEMAVTNEEESAADYPQEWFEEEMGSITDNVTTTAYEVSTLGDAETIYYSAVLSAEGMEMDMMFYIIFTDGDDYAFSGYSYGIETTYMDELIASIELN